MNTEIYKYKKDAAFELLYKSSFEDSEKFWADAASIIDWEKKFTKVKNCDFKTAKIKWFEDGKLNIVYNCIDRHLESKSDKIAIIWENDQGDKIEKITYRQLYENVNKFCRLLIKYNIKKGDNIIIYMPMIPSAIYAMLAAARIGAVHSVVFGGFSAKSLKDRIKDCNPVAIITADNAKRGGKIIPLKENIDIAVEDNKHIHVMTLKHVDENYKLNPGDIDILQEIKNIDDAYIKPEIMQATDPLFILYTSGSTGKPKGLVHNIGGYAVQTSYSFKYSFDYQEDDIYWCTADIGWITGHSYTVYGPLINGATILIYEGVPNYPDWSRTCRMIDRHKVSIFYTAPTYIRAQMAQQEEYVTKSSRDSLRVLGSVGEPINPEAWRWYYKIIGKEKCPVIDTWWQTETGAHMITGCANKTDLKAGSAGKSFFGIQASIVNDQNKKLKYGAGSLCIDDSWPSQAVTIYNDHQRFIDTYFSAYPGRYFSGDGAILDEDGFFTVTGRMDDVLNVSGHRLGTAEIESALVLHEKVAEASVVGCRHPIKGEAIYCFVTLNYNVSPSDALKAELIAHTAKEISPIAKPDYIQWTKALPKTASGKIMRRILRKIVNNEYEDLGDTATLLNPEIIDELIANKLN